MLWKTYFFLSFSPPSFFHALLPFRRMKYSSLFLPLFFHDFSKEALFNNELLKTFNNRQLYKNFVSKKRHSPKKQPSFRNKQKSTQHFSTRLCGKLFSVLKRKIFFCGLLHLRGTFPHRSAPFCAGSSTSYFPTQKRSLLCGKQYELLSHTEAVEDTVYDLLCDTPSVCLAEGCRRCLHGGADCINFSSHCKGFRRLFQPFRRP